MVFRSYALGLTLACAGALSFGCGDDSGDDKGSNEPRDAAVDSSVPVADSGTAPVDSGARADSGSAPVDSGARDSGTNLDSSAPRADGSVSDAGTSDSSVGPSMACKTCEAKQCKSNEDDFRDLDFSKLCDGFGTAMATAGGGTGKLKKTLCENYLSCARRTGCANGLFSTNAGNETYACFCGTLSFDECQPLKTSELPGPCAIQAAEAFEVSGTSPAMNLHARTLNPQYAGGMATHTLRCDLHICADECYAPCKDKEDGALCGNSTQSNCGTPPCPLEQQVCTAKSCSNYSQGEEGSSSYWIATDGGTP